MPYGKLNRVMEQVLRPHLKDQEVWDLGAGDLALAQRLVQLGAKKVVAVEKEPMRGRPGKIELKHGYFKDVADTAPDIIPVVFLSWPQTRPQPGLLDLVDRALKVIYLGSNTDGNACGFPRLFANFYYRTLLAHVPCQANSMMVYDTYRHPKEEPRLLVAEEFAIFQPKMLRWDEVAGRKYPLPRD